MTITELLCLPGLTPEDKEILDFLKGRDTNENTTRTKMQEVSI